MTKPAMLQINTAGAWRNVCEFDVADGPAMSHVHVMEAGATLAAYGLNSPKVRIDQFAVNRLEELSDHVENTALDLVEDTECAGETL